MLCHVVCQHGAHPVRHACSPVCGAQREKSKEEGAEKKKTKAKKAKRKRKASSDEDEKSEEEPEEEEEEERQESPKKKKIKKEKKEKPKGKDKKKKKSKRADSGEDDDMAEQERTPEPEASDVPGRIKYLLRKMIQTADLQTLTSRLCKEHIKQQFGEDGEAVAAEHKQLIKDTIDFEVNRRQ